MIVFKIQNKVTDQNYVGSCRSDIFARWELYVRAAEAGLDFPLYQEIREHGEADFAVTELDFAEDIAELKEMELLHTIEHKARSLRSYKFGRTDAVVKRCRQADLNTAWMKDLPASDRPAPQPSARIKPEQAPSRSVGAETKTPSARRAPIATAASSVPAAPVPPSPAPVRSAAAASGELDRALFAEGVGLLVRTLACAEQLSGQRRQADDQSQALSWALEASDQALIELERQQRRAAERAAQVQAAVDASCQANAVLVQAQGQVRQCADTVLNLLQDGRAAAEGMDELQQGVIGLLARLKGPAGESAPATEQKSPGNAGPAAMDKASEVTETVEAAPLPFRGFVPEDATSGAEVDSAELAAQEARMVNGLKGLKELLVETEATAEVPQTEPAVLEKAARAWVAADTGADAARVLEKEPLAATVIHRRAKPVDAAHGRRGNRRTLSIRAR